MGAAVVLLALVVMILVGLFTIIYVIGGRDL